MKKWIVRKAMQILSKAGILGSWETENPVARWLAK